MVPLSYYLIFAALLFCIGLTGVLVRRNMLIIFMSIELMLNAVNLNLVAFSYFLNSLAGQILVFFVITVAAAEAAVGLAIIMALHRNKPTINVDEADELKG